MPVLGCHAWDESTTNYKKNRGFKKNDDEPGLKVQSHVVLSRNSLDRPRDLF